MNLQDLKVNISNSISSLLDNDKPTKDSDIVKALLDILDYYNHGIYDLYIGMEFPEVQKYMESTRWNEVGFDADRNLWFVPKSMIKGILH